MARILICHVPKDGAPARDLGSALMGRGHFVSFDGDPDVKREDRVGRVRQFDSVLVIWSEHSVDSAGLLDIAREALPLNILVPVKSDTLSAGTLPLAFRKLNMFSPRDLDGIARLVGRLSSAIASIKDRAMRDTLMEEEARETAQRDAARRAEEERAIAAREAKAREHAEKARAEREAFDRELRNYLGDPEEPSEPPTLVEGFTTSRARAPRPSAATRAETAVSQGLVRPLHGLPDVAVVQNGDGAGDAAAFPPNSAAFMSHPPGGNTFSTEGVRAEEIDRLIDRGLLIFYVPESIMLGEPLELEVALAPPEFQGPQFGLPGREASAVLARIESMSVSLYGDGGAFVIERGTERTQVVGPRIQGGGLRGRDMVGRWTWTVVGQVLGGQELVVRISLLLRDQRGVPTPLALPDRRFPLRVSAREGGSILGSLTGWLKR